MKKSDVIQAILKKNGFVQPQQLTTTVFAPINIALCKYWGKRDAELNLPITSSLSVAVPTKGTMLTLTWHDKTYDVVILNGKAMLTDTAFVRRLQQFLDLFRRRDEWCFQVVIQTNIPVAAGLASSASGFAALVLALNDLFAWNLAQRELSILARLGSGSAARSLEGGFVEWHKGSRSDGMDSYAESLPDQWPGLYIGILTVDDTKKTVSSRKAMQHTVDTSQLYAVWPEKAERDLLAIKQAIRGRDFFSLGKSVESNALTMHATLLSSWPPICYFLPDTLIAMQRIWALRQAGLELYFTQDAGPNLKLLFLEENREAIRQAFPTIEMVPIFDAVVS